MFAMKKKKGVRLVVNMEPLNAVSIQDATLLPNITEFAEWFVGYSIYGLLDMLSGFDAQFVHPDYTFLQAFHSPAGPREQTTMVQGYTNLLQEYQQSFDHSISQHQEWARAFVNDCGLKGPPSQYDNEEIHPGIGRYVWEYVECLNSLLGMLIIVGCTTSGPKAILAAINLQIIRSVVLYYGWHIEPSVRS